MVISNSEGCWRPWENYNTKYKEALKRNLQRQLEALRAGTQTMKIVHNNRVLIINLNLVSIYQHIPCHFIYISISLKQLLQDLMCIDTDREGFVIESTITKMKVNAKTLMHIVLLFESFQFSPLYWSISKTSYL